ncbi:MAG TPA: hypothetical protein VGX68_12080 [Thermoanaerobaculia bacterium]|nr:hypothetical protein [Thermoanaerobaculia bacterium]
MSLSAADCLRRGWTNLSANWELVVIQWLESFLVALLMALGLVLALLALGMNAPLSDQWTARAAAEALRRLAGSSPALPLALAALLSVWLLTLLLHCFLQAGTYGVMTAADRQALPGGRRHRLLFRTFSLRDFCGWGGLYVWRFLGLLVLFWGLALLMGMAVVLWLVFLGAGGLHWGTSAALGIGCGGALPMGFLLLVMLLWFQVAQAGLAWEGSGVRASARRGLAVLGRRLGAVIGLTCLCVGGACAVALAFFPFSAAAESLLAGAPRVRALVQLLLLLLQALPSTLLAMGLAGSLVALVRSETRRLGPEVQAA